jgi:hypothetical protein
MFLLCVLYSKDKRQNAEQSDRETSTDEKQRKNKSIKKIPRGGMDVVL